MRTMGSKVPVKPGDGGARVMVWRVKKPVPRSSAKKNRKTARVFRHYGAATAEVIAVLLGRLVTERKARILDRATAVFGSRLEAEQWLVSPVMGLNQRRPIDLLGTADGAETVEDFLGRVEYGVYM